jgi:2-polyprenyl-6-methoxyphenol hydroxylase-like FAD-dependent oxidoreductase
MTVNIGQGACQAIEDSVVLARHLADASDPAAALRAFAAERRDRTAGLAKISRRVGTLNGWSNPVAVRIRELLMQTTFGPAAKNFRKTLGYDAAEARSVLV